MPKIIVKKISKQTGPVFGRYLGLLPVPLTGDTNGAGIFFLIGGSRQNLAAERIGQFHEKRQMPLGHERSRAALQRHFARYRRQFEIDQGSPDMQDVRPGFFDELEIIVECGQERRAENMPEPGEIGRIRLDLSFVIVNLERHRLQFLITGKIDAGFDIGGIDLRIRHFAITIDRRLHATGRNG